MSNHYLKYGIGIDIAKEKFDVCIGLLDTGQAFTKVSTAQFLNTRSGLVQFLKWAKKHCKHPLPLLFVMEATGVYYEQLALYLFQQGEKVAVVLPNKAKKYKESLGLKSKNDGIDALGLSRMACEQALPLWKAPDAGIHQLRMLTRQIQSVASQITVATNQLEAVRHGMYASPQVEKMLTGQISFFKKQKAKLLASLKQTIQEDPYLHSKFNKIQIKGLGLLTLATVVAETGGFELFKSSAHLVSYAGYDVIENQSGKHQGKTKISKKGNSHLRYCLHFPALNMVRYRIKPFVSLYERVYDRSRIKMKGYTAVQKKLLVMIYTLWKNDTVFDENYRLDEKQVIPLEGGTTQDKQTESLLSFR